MEAPETSACDDLLGARFRSVEPFPAGLGEDGPVVGHQYIHFSEEARSFQWTREDMTYTGGYRCRDGSIEVAGGPFTDGRAFTARLEPELGRLTWNGIEFERLP